MQLPTAAPPVSAGRVPEGGVGVPPHPSIGRSVWWWHGIVASLVVAYAVSTFVVRRPASGYTTLWEGWVYNFAETLPAVPIFLRVWRRAELRSAWCTMGLAVLLNSVGNLVYTYHDQNLNPVPNPAPSDIFYLLDCAAFILGVALLTQAAFGRIHLSVRLDGAIAGLAVGAVVGTIWFGPLLHGSGHPLQVAVNLAYPSSDLVLVVLLVAGLAPQRYRPGWPVAVTMAGVVWFLVGNIISMREQLSNSYVTGTPLDVTWLIGLALIGLASSLPTRRPSAPGAPGQAIAGIGAVPVMASVVSIGVVVALMRQPHYSEALLATALGALLLVILRMSMTLRELRQSAVNYTDARTDYLTDLPNRRAFLEGLSARHGRDGVVRAGMLLIDLDGFKEVNDALGHAAGDELLQQVARRFERYLGDAGLLARLGGDEFAFACAPREAEDLEDLAEQLVGQLVAPFPLEEITVRVGASVGVVLAGAGCSAGELLRCADVALYEAKRAQSGVSLYRADSDPNSRSRLELLSSLRLAITAKDLVLHYQPQVDLATGCPNGAEALVRWPHPELGLLYPDEFVPLAEQNGLVLQLTRVVMDSAVEEAARLARHGHRLQMSVNISRHDLLDESFVGYVDQVLQRHDFPAHLLTLEITETVLGDDPERAARCVQQLRAHNVKVSIDDFGVGYSSMSQLTTMGVDELKIDKSFVLKLREDPRMRPIVQMIVTLAEALGLAVVAEGVEDSEVMAILREDGIGTGQGYGIARPMSADQLEEFVGAAATDGPVQAAALVGAGQFSPTG
ncbi:MAG TPA: EAL domain-containing protein [Acidimicrobiales bacterium]|nr:EAL domain-containing protein [Acidimicrobiales bacterium]